MIGGTIPVRPYLKRFIKYIDNLDDGQAIDIYSSGMIAHTLKMLLTYKSYVEVDENRNLPKELTETISYTVNISHFNRGKIHLSKGAILEFDRHVYFFFHEVLLQKVIQYVNVGKKEKEAINDFCDDLGIQEEISFEGLKKSNYRLRTVKKIPHFYAQNVDTLKAS